MCDVLHTIQSTNKPKLHVCPNKTEAKQKTCSWLWINSTSINSFGCTCTHTHSKLIHKNCIIIYSIYCSPDSMYRVFNLWAWTFLCDCIHTNWTTYNYDVPILDCVFPIEFWMHSQESNHSSWYGFHFRYAFQSLNFYYSLNLSTSKNNNKRNFSWSNSLSVFFPFRLV